MNTLLKQRVVQLHRHGWGSTFQWMAFGIGFTLLEGVLFLVLVGGPGGWLGAAMVAFLVVVLAHVMHGHTLAFHEAVHWSLSPVPLLNEFFGLHVSFFNLLSLQLFRVVHQTHHSYLATPHDYELWPFVDLAVPRWARRAIAFLELTCGIITTPVLYSFAYFRARKQIREPWARRRVVIEQGLLIVVWLAVLVAVAWWDLWKYWLLRGAK